MKLLFNKENKGAEELVRALGMIADDVDFSKWEPILPLAVRQLNGIVGVDVMLSITNLYWADAEKTETELETIFQAQRAVAFFAWGKMIPTLDAQHGSSGRQRKLGENEKGLTALQEYKDEMNILNLAYEATDALVEYLEAKNPSYWDTSRAKRNMKALLIRNKDEFDECYVIGSHRLFLTLVPIMREIQRADILPIIGTDRLSRLINRESELSDQILELCQCPLALLTIKKAVERLPIEVIPDGVIQVQQTGSIKEKIRAEKDARKAVAESLGADASRYLQELQDVITEMDAEPGEPDLYLSGPTLQSKGITF